VQSGLKTPLVLVVAQTETKKGFIWERLAAVPSLQPIIFILGFSIYELLRFPFNSFSLQIKFHIYINIVRY
jgi:hypothetical protein